MKKKITISILSIVVILFLILPITITFTQNVSLLRAYKNLIPNQLKEAVKTGFVFFMSEEYSDLISVNQRLENKYVQLSKEKDLVNSEFLPQTQFQKVEYKEVALKTFRHHKSKLDNERRGKKVIPYYIENFEDKILLLSITGESIYFETKDFF